LSIRSVIVTLAAIAFSTQCLAGTVGRAHVAAGTAAGAHRAAAAARTADPFLWLEDVNGTRALSWVKAENSKSLAVLTRDPHYGQFHAAALDINQANDRIPEPAFVDGRIFNFWQDATHVRGIWRSTSVTDYAKAQPAWTTVLDLDALANAEGKNWIWEGADCDSPSGKRCMIALSEGGEDASTQREFDVASGRFVAGGFELPRSKQNTAWIDDDTLLVAREWTPGELTASSYPYVAKRVRRGQPLADAVEVFRGTPADVSVEPAAYYDGQGHRAVFVDRAVSFFQTEKHFVIASATPKLEVPLKANIVGLAAGRLLVKLNEDWQSDSGLMMQGSLVSLDLAASLADPQHLRPSMVYAPDARGTLEDVGVIRDRVVITAYENVKGRAFVATPDANGTWTMKPLDVADDSSVTLDASNVHGSEAFLSVTSFLTPTRLQLVDTNAATLATVKELSPKFDASGDVVEQHEATSKDGTRVPYFIVHRKNIRLDGSNPTILYAYGGFAASITPRYNGTLGKLWLERGGTYVVANIRGGGEFGPAWHEAGLTTHRQRIYDDFAAVARDLIARNITTPRRLGIQGGSNGGLLMGVEFTQHPELWYAVDIQVPLLDMLRYEKIQAGASWVGEYGSVSNPKQRAFLASISPYNNLRAGVRYPEPFIWTTTKDDRVGPQHARKFAAKLASLGKPYLYYEVIEGGHGAGANIEERSLTTALELTYFTRAIVP